MRSSQEKFPNEPILKIRKSLSLSNKYQKTNFNIAKSKPKISVPQPNQPHLAGPAKSSHFQKKIIYFLECDRSQGFPKDSKHLEVLGEKC